MSDRPHPLPRRLALAAIGTACALTAIHGLLALMYTVRHLVPGACLQWFDMRYDYSVPSWLGFLCFLAAGVTCLCWARAIRSVPIGLTGAFFVLLMIDDLFMLHERTGAAFAAPMQGTGVYAWVIVLGLPFSVAGVCAFRSCRRHLAADRTACLRLFTGFACLGAALVLEVAEERTIHSGIRLRGFDLVVYHQMVEEFLELIGPILVAWSAGEAWLRVKTSGAMPGAPSLGD